MERERGFTLIELMIALVIAAILLAAGIPSFKTIMANNRISAATNEISIALNLARSEAIKRGAQVDVTQASGGWSKGITVELSDGTDLRVLAGSAGSINITGSVTKISYYSTGLASTTATFSICDDDRTGETGRQITVTATGRISLSNKTCS